MKQKKILSLFLVLGLAFSMTTGCGNSASTSGTEATESEAETTVTESASEMAVLILSMHTDGLFQRIISSVPSGPCLIKRTKTCIRIKCKAKALAEIR